MISSSTFSSGDSSFSVSPSQQPAVTDRLLHSMSMKVATLALASMPFAPDESLAQEKAGVKPSEFVRAQLLEPAPVHVRLSCIDRSGKSDCLYQKSGTLARLSNEGFFFDDEQTKEAQFIPHCDVLRANFETASWPHRAPSTSGPAEVKQAVGTEVVLADGSSVLADSVCFQESTCTITCGDMTGVVNYRQVRSIRYSSDSEYDADWNRIAGREGEGGTTFVIRKGPHLDYLEVGLRSISADVVTIEYSGQVIPVKIEGKVEGLVFNQLYPGKEEEKSRSVCVVRGTFGRIEANALEYGADSTVSISTASGLKISVPTAEVKELDYSCSKSHRLEEIRNHVVHWNPAANQPEESAVFDSFLSAPITPSSNQPVRILGELQSDVLTVATGANLRFKTSRQFDRLIGSVQLHDSAQPGSSTIRFLDGERVLFETQLTQPEKASAAAEETGILRLIGPLLPGVEPELETTASETVKSVLFNVDLTEVRSLDVEVSGRNPVSLIGVRALLPE